MGERTPWERLENEPALWFYRFERYRMLGPDRSLLATSNQWRLERSRRVLTSSPKSWAKARDRWRWQERAEAWDAYLLELVGAREQERRVEILSSGYALQHERIRELDELARLLLDELQTEDKRWLPDVKAIGSSLEGTFERVDIVRFNAALVREFRDTLADLAAEVGERVKGLEISGKGGKDLLPVADLVAALRAADETLGDDAR